MTERAPKRHPVLRVCVFLAFALIVVAVLIPPLTVTRAINIFDGRIRERTTLYGIAIHTSVSDSAITTAATLSSTPTRADGWKAAHTRTIPTTSRRIHWSFGGAVGDARLFGDVFASAPPDLRRAVAERMLHLWQTSQSDDDAGQFLNAVAIRALELQERDAVLTLEQFADLLD